MKNKKLDYYLKILKSKNFVQDKKAKSLSFFYKGKSSGAIFDKTVLLLIKKISFLIKDNIRINLHKNKNENYHDMIILQRKNTVIKPHRHPSGGETIHLIYGKMNVFLMNSKGVIKKKLQMNTKKNLVYRVPGKIFHTYNILSNYVVYHENKSGPYDRNKNMIFLEKKIK
jgi:cupin fold WbuC family metalloprotein